MNGKMIQNTIEKTVQKNRKKTGKRSLTAILTAGALTLGMFGTQAQVVSTPYGNLPAGASPVSLSPSAPYTSNAYNANTQNYSVFGGANGNPYGSPGFGNIYGVGVYGGLGGYGGTGGMDVVSSYFGMPFGGFFGTPLGGGNISVVSSPYYGGFSSVGPNGTYFSGPNGPYNPYLNPDGGNPTPGTSQASRGADDSKNASAIVGTQDRTSPAALARSIVIKRGRDYAVSVGWRGDPTLLGSMKVTLLNRYHIPLAHQEAVADTPAYFAAGQTAFAARYYRIDVTYADGAVATMTGRLNR